MTKERKEMAAAGLIFGYSLLAILLIAGVFFLLAAIFMWTWNYAMPRLVESVDSSYVRETRFTEMDYVTAIVAFILLGIMFSPYSMTHLHLYTSPQAKP